MASIPNGFGGAPRAGIFLGGYGNRIGTNSDGVSDDLERNLISGNSQRLHRGHLLQQPAQPRRAAHHHRRELDGRERHRPGGACPTISASAARPASPVIIRDNVIAAHTFEGISTHSSNMLIIGNRIGVGADGVTPLGNGYNGISLSGNDNVIGGTGPG